MEKFFLINKYFSWRNFSFVESHKINYKIWGRDKRDVIVCAHASTGSSEDFEYFAKLASDRYQVIAFDFTGRGKSNWLKNKRSYNYYTYLNDAKKLLDNLCKKKRIHWLGSSMGGIVGMILSNYYHISSLILNDIGPFIPENSIQKISKYMDLDPTFYSFDEVMQYCKMAYCHLGIEKEDCWLHLANSTVRFCKEGFYKLRYDPKIVFDLNAKKKRRKPLWKFWDRVKCPVLVVRGSKSKILLVKTLFKMLQKKNVDKYEIEKSGHFPYLYYEKDIVFILDWIDNNCIN